MLGSRSLPHAARTTERFQPEDAGSGPSGASYVWDQALDGPEHFVVMHAPSRVFCREFGNRLLRSAEWALVACGFMEMVRSAFDRSNPAWSVCVTFCWCTWTCALEPELPKSLVRCFQLMKQDTSGGGPQRPAAA